MIVRSSVIVVSKTDCAYWAFWIRTNTKGNAIEFMTPEGFVELVSANGCPETEIHIGDKVTGTENAVETGQLLTRYYFRNRTPDNMPLLRMESPSQEPWQMCSQKAFIWAIT